MALLTQEEQAARVDEAFSWIYAYCEQAGLAPGGVIRAIGKRIEDGDYIE